MLELIVCRIGILVINLTEIPMQQSKNCMFNVSISLLQLFYQKSRMNGVLLISLLTENFSDTKIYLIMYVLC